MNLNSATLTKIQDTLTLFMGLIVESFPFVIIGILVSTAIAYYFKEEWIFKVLPKNKLGSHFMLSILGMFFPVCECGNIPVMRRLLSKGFNVSHAVTFLLAAPIINVITIWSTLEAFSYDKSFLAIRLVSAFVIANLVGILISFKKNQEEFLTDHFFHEHCNHDHYHDKKIFQIFREEFTEVMRMLIFGAFVAAAFQVFIPRDIIIAFGSNPVLSVLAMMLLAFVISICANVDAFFALSYADRFTKGSLLSFMVFGPMIDIKIISMLKTTLKAKLIWIIVTLVSLSSLLVGLLVNFVTSI